MTGGFFAALLVGSAAMTAGSTDIAHRHSARIDHHRGAIDAQYSGRVGVVYKQVGAVTPGRVPSSLRCQWQARLIVERDARHASGATMTRTMVRDRALTGSRPGWCSGAKAAIARDVAAHDAALRAHLLALAADDHDVLTAEIDRLHDRSRRG
ncbi:hypothetical protein ASE86_02695 [Sphingomonas sp. Leaf33]|uniref:hypothetical protein n=1 Tax=Sphingomonas sp. Leaf33 TaxID=1736215 RepID=UPI0006FA4611|nr:hypothetical protein [Sphingomonas sp. Leaf33]KQN25185.1 hypothetical protein ASE86_02695 [Sphingomonas sp. Leaf33]